MNGRTRDDIYQLALLAAPGVLGMLGIGMLLGIPGLLKAVCGILVAPYVIGGYELYKGWSIRKTQKVLLTLVPPALEAADRLIPELLADGLSGEVLKERLREELTIMTSGQWSDEQRPVVVEQAIAEAFNKFDPSILLDRAALAKSEPAMLKE